MKEKEFTDLIAPCGMNCSLCVAHISYKHDLNKKGYNRKYCPGCIPRGKNCTFALAKKCDLIANGKIRFCYECDSFPCESLVRLDKRYKTKYNMSMIDNLRLIKEAGVKLFLEKEEQKWKCRACGEFICCHKGVCLNCQENK